MRVSSASPILDLSARADSWNRYSFDTRTLLTNSVTRRTSTVSDASGTQRGFLFEILGAIRGASSSIIVILNLQTCVLVSVQPYMPMNHTRQDWQYLELFVLCDAVCSTRIGRELCVWRVQEERQGEQAADHVAQVDRTEQVRHRGEGGVPLLLLVRSPALLGVRVHVHVHVHSILFTSRSSAGSTLVTCV